MPRKKTIKKEKVEEPKVEEPKEELKEEPQAETEKIAVMPSPINKFTIEKTITSGGPQARALPKIVGGICEFCGVLDPKLPSYLQYTAHHHPNCPNRFFEGMELRCTYCPEGTDWNDVIAHREFRIWESPIGSGNLTVCCSDMRCENAHLKRFQIKRTI